MFKPQEKPDKQDKQDKSEKSNPKHAKGPNPNKSGHSQALDGLKSMGFYNSANDGPAPPNKPQSQVDPTLGLKNSAKAQQVMALAKLVASIGG